MTQLLLTEGADREKAKDLQHRLSESLMKIYQLRHRMAMLEDALARAQDQLRVLWGRQSNG